MGKEADFLDIVEANGWRGSMREEIDLREKARNDWQLQETLAWLALDDCDSEQEELLNRSSEIRQGGTCEWILEHNNLKNWLYGDKEHPVIWVRGKPGAGKFLPRAWRA